MNKEPRFKVIFQMHKVLSEVNFNYQVRDNVSLPCENIRKVETKNSNNFFHFLSIIF